MSDGTLSQEEIDRILEMSGLNESDRESERKRRLSDFFRVNEENVIDAEYEIVNE
jgi:hypothetical protein